MPVEGLHRTRGRFGGREHGRSWQAWASRHRGAITALLGLAAAGAVMLSSRPARGKRQRG